LAELSFFQFYLSSCHLAPLARDATIAKIHAFSLELSPLLWIVTIDTAANDRKNGKRADYTTTAPAHLRIFPGTINIHAMISCIIDVWTYKLKKLLK